MNKYCNFKNIWFYRSGTPSSEEIIAQHFQD